jgi:DNA-binding NarL/FixJ family response regulator
MASKSVVVIEDDLDMQHLIRLALEVQPELEVVGEATTADGGVSMVEQAQPDAVVLNHYLDDGGRGLDIVPRLKVVAPRAKVLLFSSHDLTVEASRQPDLDAFLNKRRLTSLPSALSSMLGLG